MTEVINVRLDLTFCACIFQHLRVIGLCDWERLAINLLILLFKLQVRFGLTEYVQFQLEMFYKIILDTNK